MQAFKNLDDIKQYLRDYARARDWEQFHAPKNLAMAMAVEVAELMEIFQWLSEAQSAELTGSQRQSVKEEMADVFLYLMRMADVLNIDLLAAASEKVVSNEQRYPADKVRGSARKYSEYHQDTSD